MIRDKVKPKIKAFNGPNTKKWIKHHMQHAAEATYVKHFIWNRKAPAIGPFCTDIDNNIFLDFAQHVAVTPLGYNNPKLLNIAKKINIADPDRYAGTDFITVYNKDPKNITLPTVTHLHKKVYEITKHLGLDKSFFTNSGAEATENAIKLAYNKSKNNGFGVGFNGAFHGRTLGVLSLNMSKDVQRKWYPKIPKIIHISYCTCKYDCNCKAKKTAELENIIEKNGKGEINYVIMEPIQGEGGYRIPNKSFIQGISKLCKKNNIPLIIDEIQSGMGRTGKWWAIENFNVKPDIMAAGKALRVGATISKSKYFPKEQGRISSTWGEGNALSSAIGYKTIEIIQKENLLKNAQVKGKYFLKRLLELPAKDIIDVRGIGLMDAIEFKTEKQRNKVEFECHKNGFLVLGCGEKAIRFLPPLDVRERELDLAIEILKKGIKKI